MKPSGVWLPKGGKQRVKDGITECMERLTLSRLTAVLAIGSLVFIGVTSAFLGVLWDGPKKVATLKLGTAELNGQRPQQDAVDTGSKCGSLGPARSTSGYPFFDTDSSKPPQDVVPAGLPGSVDQTPSLATKPTLSGFGSESDAKKLRATRQHNEAASPNTKKRHRRSDSFLAAMRHALRFRIVQWLNKL